MVLRPTIINAAYGLLMDNALPAIKNTLAHDVVFPENTKKGWFNYKPPTEVEMQWIKKFGQYPNFDPDNGKLTDRLTLEIANLKEATRIIVVYHYLHRGRTMAQLPYWILIDEVPVGLILFAYPRISVPLFDTPPLNILELARLWINPDVQDRGIKTNGKHHAFSVASCAIGTALKRLQGDWYSKYPKSPDVLAVCSWADDAHHEGTVYKATNFEPRKKSGGSLHGARKRNNGGNDQMNADYLNVKTLWWRSFKKPLTQHQKRHIDLDKEKNSPEYNQLFFVLVPIYLPSILIIGTRFSPTGSFCAEQPQMRLRP
jgi:hypothetical protein|tara:strand:+ start:1767 stop:2711 length:945 start_codon:yes stop_codon:yes gene_type:complete